MGKTRVAAYALIEKGSRILLCRVSSRIQAHAGKWTLPGGGIEFGEDPGDAVVREVREETGLLIRPLDLVGVDSLFLDGDSPASHHVRLIYRVEMLGGTLRHEVEGTTDLCAWHDMGSLSALPQISLVERALGLRSEALSVVGR